MEKTTGGLCELAGTVRFGPFEANLRARELRKRGMRLHLPEKPFQVLELLLERSGEVITRRELRERLWPGVLSGFDRCLNTAINTLRQVLGDSARSWRYVETRPRRGYRFIAPVEVVQLPATRSSPIIEACRSIAVLPFRNLSSDAEADYLSDGIAETILQSLSQLPHIRVMARSSVFRYKGRDVDPLQAGRELNVNAVVAGSVNSLRGERESLAVSVELVDVANGWRIWGRQFDRSFSDLLNIEAEIATEISLNLSMHLSGEERDRLSKRRTESVDAHEDYLKGRYHWNKLTEEGLRKSIAFFERATQKDPEFAMAYSGLADAYGLCGFFGAAAPLQVFPLAKPAALRAIQADPQLGEAHASLASILKVFEWDWAGAEREYRLAISLSPNYANAHRWYAGLLSALGRVEEGRREIETARKLDPLSLVVGVEVAWNYLMAREFARAREESLKTLDLEPDFPAAHYGLGLACEQLGRFKEAVASLERARDASEANTATLAALGHAYGSQGRRREAERILEDLMQNRSRKYVSSYLIALVHAGFRKPDAAFACLEAAVAERDAWLVWLRAEPRFDGLRPDPRFAELLGRLCFPAWRSRVADSRLGTQIQRESRSVRSDFTSEL